jgi:predicted transcriptional regulator
MGAQSVSKSRSDVTETELAILDVLWSKGEAEIREIVEAIYMNHTQALHATVKSLLNRLMEKGLVTCERGRFVHRFSASIDREAFVGSQLEKLAESHFDGSFAPMLLTLIERVRLSKRDRATLRKIIDGIE